MRAGPWAASREGLQARVERAVARRLGGDAGGRLPAARRLPGRAAGGDRPGAGRRRPGHASLARTLPFVVATTSGRASSSGRPAHQAPCCSTPRPARPTPASPWWPPAGAASPTPSSSWPCGTAPGRGGADPRPRGGVPAPGPAVGGQVVRFAVSRGCHVNPFDLPPVEVDEQTGEPSDPVDEQAARPSGACSR